MFKTLKSLKEKYKNSSSWGEFFASYLIDLESIYKKLEGKTEKQQIEILKKALEDQTKKTKELIGEVSKQNELIEELTRENQKLKSSQGISLDNLIKEINELTGNVNEVKALIKVNQK